ncbi:uncharacterized protein [Zea mays]|uniref:uncharacterized protein LOC109029535 isoform 1 n=1 Tax=Zea mays TaxID=4577 RepID=UPI0002211170|nr:uncharacterized protein LOC109029535 isoform1 [Zea mays]XP_035820901.1 uncharacterized protein LOC109029535 isoform X1 [Zea mays]XP_035820902.1 uncharacterized protein LOC109029535 isoform X1 [Zea mays]|eukprot:NP_001333847.1 uncharacterized protein LOC109029535 isoform1 [Zea mays]
MHGQRVHGHGSSRPRSPPHPPLTTRSMGSTGAEQRAARARTLKAFGRPVWIGSAGARASSLPRLGWCARGPTSPL